MISGCCAITVSGLPCCQWARRTISDVCVQGRPLCPELGGGRPPIRPEGDAREARADATQTRSRPRHQPELHPGNRGRRPSRWTEAPGAAGQVFRLPVRRAVRGCPSRPRNGARASTRAKEESGLSWLLLLRLAGLRRRLRVVVDGSSEGAFDAVNVRDVERRDHLINGLQGGFRARLYHVNR